MKSNVKHKDLKDNHSQQISSKMYEGKPPNIRKAKHIFLKIIEQEGAPNSPWIGNLLAIY